MAKLSEITKIEKKLKKFANIDEFLTICSRDFGIKSYSITELSRNFKINVNSLRWLFKNRLLKKNRIDINWESLKDELKK